MTTNVQVRIGTEWAGRPAINQAKKDVGAFESSLNLLQKRLVGAFSVYKIAQFGKASLNAFTQDNLAAQQLNNTLAQLGLAFDSKKVADFIQQTEKLTGVLDDQLRPAMMLFLRTTKNVGLSEGLLGTALNISKASGKDLASVSSALARAYYGNYTALQRLGIGINTATLKGKEWKLVQDQLNATFAGAAKTAAESYQGSLDRLKVAADNAKESIGQGMIAALKVLSDSGSLQSAINGIEKLGSVIGKAVLELGKFIAVTKVLLKSGWTIDQKDKAALDKIKKSTVENTVVAKNNLTLATATTKQAENQVKAAQKKLDISRAELALKKQQSTFDLQAAEIAAALKNKSLTPEEVLRLNMMKTADELSKAIQDNQSQNTIDKLTESLIALQKQLKDMQDVNPFNAATQGAIALTQAVYGAAAAMGLSYTAYQSFRAGERGDAPLGAPPPPPSGNTNVTVNVNGAMTHDELAKSIQDSINNNTASGSPSTYDRNKLVAF